MLLVTTHCCKLTLSIGTPSTVREILPLLRKTLWHIHLKDWISDPDRRHRLKDLVQFTSKDEPWTVTLSNASELYLQAVRTLAYDSDFLVVRRLLSDNDSEYVFESISFFSY